jgi:hypothetical protein
MGVANLGIDSLLSQSDDELVRRVAEKQRLRHIPHKLGSVKNVRTVLPAPQPLFCLVPQQPVQPEHFAQVREA